MSGVIAPAPTRAGLATQWARVGTLAVIVTTGILGTARESRAQATSSGGALIVEVTDASGAPIADARVFVEHAGGTPARRDASRNGLRYEVRGLGDAAVTVVATRDGFAPDRRDILVAADRVQTLHVVLQPATLSEHVEVTAPLSPASETALRMTVASVDLPRSVTVLGAARIKEQHLQSVSEVLAYVPGMSVNSYRTGSYHFYSRGYRMGPEDTRVDGFVGVNAGGRYGGSTFGVEDVVFLRGPAGIHYGSAGSPGGLVNLVSKQPQPTPLTRVDVRMGGYAGGGIGARDRVSSALDVDSTGPVAGSRRVQYRALVTGERMRYFTDGVDDDNRYASASMRVAFGRRVEHSVTPMMKWTRFDRPQGGGLVVSPTTSLSTRDGVRGPIRTADLSPLSVNHASGGGVDALLQGGVDARGILPGAVQYAGAYRFVTNDTDIDQFVPQADVALLAREHQLLRTQTKSRTERRYHNIEGRIERAFARGDAVRSRVNLGVSGRVASTRGTSAVGTLPEPQSPIDIYSGMAVTPLVDRYPAIAFGPWTEATYWTAFAQSQTALAHERVLVTLGLGYGENRAASSQSVRKSRLMPNAAVVVKSRPDVSLYASYSTSYAPPDPDAESASGARGTFRPATGRNVEVGIKGDHRRVTWAVAVFHSDVADALVQSGAGDLNPNGLRYYVEAGTRRSRGVELSGDAAPWPSLRVSASATWLDAIYTGAGPASAVLAIPGSRAEKSPRWAWNTWARYSRPSGRFADTGMAIGLVYQGQRLGANGPRTSTAPDPLELPAFTRVDASLTQRIGRRTELGAHVENVFDRLIFVNASVGSSIEVAAPRRISLRAGYRF